jgi:hypothetical protein
MISIGERLRVYNLKRKSFLMVSNEKSFREWNEFANVPELLERMDLKKKPSIQEFMKLTFAGPSVNPTARGHVQRHRTLTNARLPSKGDTHPRIAPCRQASRLSSQGKI